MPGAARATASSQQLVRDGKCTKIAVAHTADDQAETLLARMIRGTGSRGLVGIHPVRGAIIRPVLDIRREELREYLRAKKQIWCEDASNQDTTRLRARLRHQLLPQLERDFAPAIVERLANLAALQRDEEEILERAGPRAAACHQRRIAHRHFDRYSRADNPTPATGAQAGSIPGLIETPDSRTARKSRPKMNPDSMPHTYIKCCTSPSIRKAAAASSSRTA